jgi:hypothetical protein
LSITDTKLYGSSIGSYDEPAARTGDAAAPVMDADRAATIAVPASATTVAELHRAFIVRPYSRAI